MRLLKRLPLCIVALALLVPSVEAAGHVSKHSKKFDYRYKTPKLKYKAPKFKTHKVRHSR